MSHVEKAISESFFYQNNDNVTTQGWNGCYHVMKMHVLLNTFYMVILYVGKLSLKKDYLCLWWTAGYMCRCCIDSRLFRDIVCRSDQADLGEKLG